MPLPITRKSVFNFESFIEKMYLLILENQEVLGVAIN
jgi:hypothetical protein